jgi:hypothetical protein
LALGTDSQLIIHLTIIKLLVGILGVMDILKSVIVVPSPVDNIGNIALSSVLLYITCTGEPDETNDVSFSIESVELIDGAEIVPTVNIVIL